MRSERKQQERKQQDQSPEGSDNDKQGLSFEKVYWTNTLQKWEVSEGAAFRIFYKT